MVSGFIRPLQSNIISSQVNDVAYGNAVQQLTVGGINKFFISLPEPKEQKRISDFIATVDELTVAQTKKIKGLKDHKKGLMQQLFPSVDEVTS